MRSQIAPRVLGRRVILAAAILGLTIPSARAAESLFSEGRIGLLAHDVGVFGTNKEDGVNLSGEILFKSPAILSVLWSPRPHVGLSFNTAGDTSLAYAGLTWTIDIGKAFFTDLSLGGTLHTGSLSNGPDQKALGCRALFHESLSVGYRLSERTNISLMIAHASNLSLCDHNAGIDLAGVRFGFPL